MHVQTDDLEGVQSKLERTLAPDFAAYVGREGAWVSVLAEELETHDMDDLRRLAMPLTKFGQVVAFVGEGDEIEIWRFPDGERVASDDLEARAKAFGIALECITHFDALEGQAIVPEGFVRLEPEAEKPGLKEFFGRSQDE